MANLPRSHGVMGFGSRAARIFPIPWAERMEMPLGFNVRKAAQVVAYLIAEQGGRADLIKTVKLAYMADRRFLEFYDAPILNDDFYCLDHGPVDTVTYDYIKGQGSKRRVWEKYVKPRQKNNLHLARSADDIEFDLLSDAEEEVLRAVVDEYRSLRPFELVDYIHQNCSEWTNPKGTSTHLSYDEVLHALGKDKRKARIKRIKERRQVLEVAHSES